MSKVRYVEVTEDDDGQRLDRWLKKNAPDIPYGLLQKLIRKGQVRVDKKRAKSDTRLEMGQSVRIPPIVENDTSTPKPLSEKDIAFIKSLVVYDDGDVIALNKPSGLAVQGGTGTPYHIDRLLAGLKDKNGVEPRLVHRLDKGTSGILLLARSAKIARVLGKTFKEKSIRKIYWALISPVPEIREGSIKAPLSKGTEGEDKERMFVDEEEGKYALTEYSILDNAAGKVAFAAFWPRTGRTHQIRIHAEALGCPIVGDLKYGTKNQTEDGGNDLTEINLSDRLHLHAQRITCYHPSRKGILDIQAPLPDDLRTSWKKIGFDPDFDDDIFASIDWRQ